MSAADLLTALRSGTSVFGAELRPPRAELATAEGMDAWIDTYHAVRRLTRQDTFVFLTDSAVGAAGRRQPASSRHESRSGRPALARRAVPHGEALAGLLPRRTPSAPASTGFRRSSCSAAIGRSALRARSSTPGSCAACCGSATRTSASADGPTRTPIRSGRWTTCPRPHFHAEFFLTQVVSHHQIGAVVAVHRNGRSPRHDAAGTLRRLFLSQRQSAARSRRCRVSCRFRLRGSRGSLRKGRPPKKSARGRFER